ncbi:MAG: Tripartite-type tricarboxylate transporter, receptor component TctC [Betaproteobacteria bacterium]|nr:Tripartite-type tricarboxylate transporter, receptor component TctC [Betaproteobacteria bacterium]
MKRLLRSSLFFLLFGCAGLAGAQAWPNHPVRLVVSYPAGGGADVVARLLGPKLSEYLGQQFVIENRGGAAGVIGAEVVAKSPPDGYVVLLDASAHGVNPSLQPKLPYDTMKDLAAVSLLVRVPNVVVVTPSLPVNSIAELTALAKSKPGQLSFGSSGTGSAQHLAAELYKVQAGVNMVHVPYRGGSAAMVDVMSGQVPLMFTNMASALPHVKAGKLKPLATTGSHRPAALPDLPTVAETGLKGYEVYEWNGLFVPGGTPADIIDRLQKATVKALAQADVREHLTGLGAEVVASNPAELDRYRSAEIVKWAAIIKKAGIKPE